MSGARFFAMSGIVPPCVGGGAPAVRRPVRALPRAFQAGTYLDGRRFRRISPAGVPDHLFLLRSADRAAVCAAIQLPVPHSSTSVRSHRRNAALQPVSGSSTPSTRRPACSTKYPGRRRRFYHDRKEARPTARAAAARRAVAPACLLSTLLSPGRRPGAVSCPARCRLSIQVRQICRAGLHFGQFTLHHVGAKCRR